MRYALILEATGLVVNTVVADEDWEPPDGYIKIQFDTAGIGDTWDGSQFIRPPEPPPPDPCRSGHPAVLISITPASARPARVKRICNGIDYFYDCLASQSVVNDYQAGKIIVGDYLWVEFIDDTEEIGGGEQIVIAKVAKTW